MTGATNHHETPRDASGQLPLAGMRVVEFAHIAAGPFTGMLLSDLGADVVKIEPPWGDGLRGWPPMVETEDGSSFSLNFASVNRGKRSIAADLSAEADLRLVRQLCLSSDVLIENFRPGVMQRLGLGFDELRAEHRGLVYCSISGFGQTGPDADRGAFDVVIQALGGLMSVTGADDGPPVKCGVPVADFVAGLYAALSIVSLWRQGPPRGPRQSVHVDCALLECLLAVSALQTSEYWGTGVPPRRMGSAHPRNAPYQAFQASDGSFVIAAGNDKLWEQVCQAVDRPELCHDERFADQPSRATNQRELEELLEGEFVRRPVEHWLAEFDRRGVPYAAVNDFAAILSDPQIQARGLVQQLEIPGAGSTPTTVFPVRAEGLTVRTVSAPPALGADKDDVIREWLGRAEPAHARATDPPRRS